MLFFKPKSSLGVDIGAGGIKLVELREEKKRPVLFTYGLTSQRQNVHALEKKKVDGIADLLEKKNLAPEAPQPAGEETMSDATAEQYATTLRAVCKAAKTTAKSAVVSLPVSAVFHAVVTLPVVKKDELDHLIRAEVKKLVPSPLEEMALDYQVIQAKPDEKVQRVLVNAVSHKLIAFYSKIFQRAGLALEALEPESTALARCLVGKDQAIAMLVDIGAERTNFFIVDQGVPVTHQSIESGGIKADKLLQSILGVEPELVGHMKYDLFQYLSTVHTNSLLHQQKFLDMFVQVIDPLMKEIEVSLELFTRQSGNENKYPEKIILTGGMAFIPYLANHIADKFKLKCYIGDPWARVVYQEGLKPLLHYIGPRMAVAIGLALRTMV